jgi:hypothetical protein
MNGPIRFALVAALAAVIGCAPISAGVTIGLGKAGRVRAASAASAAKKAFAPGKLSEDQILALPPECQKALAVASTVSDATGPDSPTGEAIRIAWVSIKNGEKDFFEWHDESLDVATIDLCKKSGEWLCKAVEGQLDAVKMFPGGCELRCDTGQPEYVPAFRIISDK